jgi:hypothetical protein
LVEEIIAAVRASRSSTPGSGTEPLRIETECPACRAKLLVAQSGGETPGGETLGDALKCLRVQTDEVERLKEALRKIVGIADHSDLGEWYAEEMATVARAALRSGERERE